MIHTLTFLAISAGLVILGIKLFARLMTYGFKNPKEVEWQKKAQTKEYSDGILESIKSIYNDRYKDIMHDLKNGKHNKKYTNHRLNNLNQVVYSWVFDEDWGKCPKNYKWDWDKIREERRFPWPGWLMQDFHENVCHQ